jgi:hypothetical protein
MPFFLSPLCLLLMAGAVRAEESPPAARLLGGSGFAGKLISVEKGVVRFSSEGQTRDVPLKQLVRWGHPVETRRRVTVEGRPLARVFLADGGVLVGDLTQIDGERATLFSDLFGGVRLPLGRVRGAILHPPAGRRERERLALRVQQAEGDADRLLLVNGDELVGRLIGFQENQFQLETPLGAVDAPLEKVAAFLLKPPPDAERPTGGAVLVGFRDGSLLRATRLSISPKNVRLGLGKDLTFESAEPQAVASLQPLSPLVTYLSDLAPLSYRHVPYLTVAWPYHADRDALGGRLRAGERLYSKGLGLHSASRLAYKLERPAARFAAEVALDDAAKGAGSVVFRVFTSSGGAWKEAYASGVVRGGDPPVSVSVDLAGVKALVLLVDYADRGDVLDHANWLDARLERDHSGTFNHETRERHEKKNEEE